MPRRNWIIATALASATITLPQTAQAQRSLEKIEPSAKQMAKLQALAPAHFASTVTIADDDLEPVATITTENGFRGTPGFLDAVQSDNFLRAFIDKVSGEARYQLYQYIRYSSEVREFRSANYATPNGPRSAELVTISKQVSTCYSGMCIYVETIGFDVPDEQLRQVASTYAPGASPMWRFRFKAQSGLDWEDRMSPAEVAGLLQAVDNYRATKLPGHR